MTGGVVSIPAESETGADPAVTDPDVTDPAVTDPAKTDPTGAGATGAGTMGGDQPVSGPGDLLAKMETVAANDRANARQSQQVTNDRTAAYLAYIVTVGFILMLLFVARVGVSNQNPVIFTLLGILGTGWASIISFFYGSSVGSREKNSLLGEANTPPKNISNDPSNR